MRFDLDAEVGLSVLFRFFTLPWPVSKNSHLGAVSKA